MNSIVEKDNIKVSESMFNKIENKTIFITGSTGYIGKNFIYYVSKTFPKAKIVAFVRDVEKAKSNEFLQRENIYFIDEFIYTGKIDFAIIGASSTDSKSFVQESVNTIHDNYLITAKTLDFLKEKRIQKAIFLSSMEVYGSTDKKTINESELGYISLNDVRSSYPEVKRLLELLCFSYFKQYSMPVVIVRLSQVFGPGANINDSRLMNFIFKQYIDGEDIILKTKGETVMNTIYIMDLLNALIHLLVFGENGETYNLSNEKYSQTVKEICNYIIKNSVLKTKTKLRIKLEKINEYKPVTKVILENKKLLKTGFEFDYDWEEAIINTFSYFIEETKYGK